ncbi:MAG: T3SS (YopN, CesT) and YbjN peptide-binding chaperone 1 [Arachnia sp.]
MADIEGFDFDETTTKAWADFTERLADVISVMDATSDLTISIAVPDPTLGSPAVSLSAVAPGVVEAKLTGSSAARLAELGWLAGHDGSFRMQAHQDHAGTLAQATTRTFWDVLGVLHPVFLEPDQLADILRPDAPRPSAAPPPPGTFGAVMPASQEQLDAIVDAELRRALGHPPLRNERGEVAIRVGSTVIFLRSTPDFQELVLFAAIVHDVSGRSRACEVLNDLNTESRYCRFALHRDRVFVQVSVPAQPFVPAHLQQALSSISTVADGIDDELASRLGGRTTFPS